MSSKTVGRLLATLGLDRSQFSKGLDGAKRDVQGFEGSLAAAGGRIKQVLGLSIAGIGLQQVISGARRAVTAIAQIGDEAKRSGMEVKAFQEWKYVAEQNRIGIDAMVDGFKELNLRVDEFVTTGGGSASDALKRLGFSAEELRQKLKDPSALILEIIGRMEKLDRAAQIRTADEIFGGSAGERFVELLDRGEAGIRQIMARGNELGIVMDEQMIRKAQDLDARFKEVNSRIEAMWQASVIGAAEFFGLIERETDKIRVERMKEMATSIASSLADASKMVEVAARFNSDIDGKIATDLSEAAKGIASLIEELESGKISADEFNERLQDTVTDARDAMVAVEDLDKVGFTGVIARLGDLLTMLGQVARAGREAAASMPGGGGQTTGNSAWLQGQSGDSLLPPTFNSGMKSSPRPKAPGVDSYGNWEDARKPKGGGGGGGGKGSESDYARLTQSIREQTAALDAEALAFLAVAASGVTYADAVEFARKRAELLTAAQKDGKEITPELTAEIEKLALSYVTAAQAAEDAEERLRRMQEQGKAGADAVAGIFGAMVQGSKAAKQALINLLLEMARVQAMNAALKLFGGSGIAKLVGGLLTVGANATGTGNWRGGLTRVNELGGEVLNLPKGTQIIPNDISKRMADRAAQSQAITLAITMDPSTGALGAIARNEAGQVVAEAAPVLVQQAVRATGVAMTKTKSFGGR